MNTRFQDKVVAVFGAGSSGDGWSNGKAAAVLYARHGARVFAIDVRAEGSMGGPVVPRMTSLGDSTVFTGVVRPPSRRSTAASVSLTNCCCDSDLKPFPLSG